uniref:Eukaryotic translation initiation factor 4E binding protein 2 n=1 Tax=Neogobius melanostomus TaxID=47308 RepID=A0A8C6UTG6_9GOBI
DVHCVNELAIPTRTVLINDTTQLPHDYCTTPGGTLFSTTPGGTRIIYDRKFLLDRRNSPIAQTPQPTCQSSRCVAAECGQLKKLGRNGKIFYPGPKKTRPFSKTPQQVEARFLRHCHTAILLLMLLWA